MFIVAAGAQKDKAGSDCVCVCLSVRIDVCVGGERRLAWIVYAEKGACDVCLATAAYIFALHWLCCGMLQVLQVL